MENLLLQWGIYYGLPVLGALIVRGNVNQWWRWLLWVFMCACSYTTMTHAGWNTAPASVAIIVASVIGAFIAEILEAIGANINGRTLPAIGIMGLMILVGYVFIHAPSEDVRKNIVQLIVVCTLVVVAIRMRGSGGGRS